VSGQEESDPIDQKMVTALAHPVRVQILEILNEQEASPKALTSLLERPIGVVSYHTNVLEKCGCIKQTRTEPRRGALEHFFRAEPRSFIGHQDWRKVPRSLRGNVTLTALKTFISRAIAALKAGTIDGHKDTTLTWFSLAVDQVGRAQVADVMQATIAQLQAIHAQSRQRVAMSGEALSPLVAGLSAFQAAPRREGK